MPAVEAVSPRGRSAGAWMVALSALLFGCSGVWGKKLFVAHVTPLEVTAFRTIIATLCILPFAGSGRGRAFRVTRPQFLFLLRLAVLYTAVQLSFYLTISLIGVAVAITLQYTAPLFVALWERIAHGRPLGWQRGVAILAGSIGCALLTEMQNSAALRDNAVGIASGFVSGIILAGYTLTGSRVAERGIGGMTAPLYSFGLSALVWLAFLPLYLRPETHFDLGFTRQMLLIGIGATFIPFVLMLFGLRKVGAFEATVISMIEPVTGAILAYWMFGEALSAEQTLGMALIMSAVVATTMKPKG